MATKKTLKKKKKSSLPKDAKIKRPVGRPKLDRNNLDIDSGELIKKLYKSGMTDEEVANIIGVSTTTLQKWKAENPKFADSVACWREKADLEIEKRLRDLALGYTITYQDVAIVSDGRDEGSHVEKVEKEMVIKPDVRAQQFWLKNRKAMKWKDKQEMEITDLSSMSNEDLEKKALAILDKVNGKV